MRTVRIVIAMAAAVATGAVPGRVGAGGGDHEEDIEVLEAGLEDALAMVERGEIIDAKTIILLQHMKLKGVMG